MSDPHDIMDDPTNRIVAAFETAQSAETARSELEDVGIAHNRIHTLQGRKTAEDVDTSAKWFADTDQEMEQFQQQLLAGNTIISIPVADEKTRETVHDILKRHGAFRMTHFGQWVTRVMR